MRRTIPVAARSVQRGPDHLWGAPGGPVIKLMQASKAPAHYSHSDIVCTSTWSGKANPRLLAYMGKHVPHPQKSLWSPDTPVPQDRYLYKLTTLDIDSFKYWFGVNRARVMPDAWVLFHRAGLLPPSFNDHNPEVPRPVFDKDQLMRYYLKHRKPLEQERRERKLVEESSFIRTDAEKAADRPSAPWL